MRLRRRSLGILLLVAGSIASPARGGTLWYNGDNDNRDSLANVKGAAITAPPGTLNSFVFDNFVVPTGQTWTLTGVFSNDQIAFANGAVKTATWTINQNLGLGTAGTVVASGDTAATLTAVPPTSGTYYAGPEYKVDAAVTTLVKLTAGTYYLSVAPDDPSGNSFGDKSFIETTSGINSIGMPNGNDGNSFVTNNLPSSNPGSYNYATAASVLAGDGISGPVDFSMGVEGIASSVVPEPSSLVMVLVGLFGASSALRRRRRSPAA